MQNNTTIGLISVSYLCVGLKKDSENPQLAKFKAIKKANLQRIVSDFNMASNWSIYSLLSKRGAKTNPSTMIIRFLRSS